MIRTVHLDSGMSMRGGQWQALHLMQELIRLGHGVILLAADGAPLSREASRRGIPVKPLRLRQIWRAAEANHLLHAHDARSHTLAAIASRLPFIVSRRVAFPVNTGLLSRWKYSRPAHYIAVSAFVRRMLEKAGIPARKLSVVYDSVPLPEPAVPSRDFRVLTLEFDDPRKGSDLVRSSGVDAEFTRDLEGSLPGASAFLYLTYSEGLGSAILMAMAYGVPVVASRVGGIPEIVDDGVTGLLVENRPEDVAGAVNRLRSDPELGRRLAQNARRQVEDRFTPLQLAENTIRIYEQVLS